MNVEDKMMALRSEYDSIADMETLVAAYKLGRDEMLKAAILMTDMVRCEDGCDGIERVANAFRELQ